MNHSSPRSSSASWFPHTRRLHAFVMGCFSLLFALMHPLLLGVPLSYQLPVLVALVACFGVPHGALDHIVGRQVLKPHLGRHWHLPFLLVYVGLASMVLVCWWVAPVWSLLLFLLTSALHFGLEDTEDGWQAFGGRYGHLFEAFVRGGAAILLPAVFFPAQVAQVFSWLLHLPMVVVKESLGAVRWPLFGVWLVAAGVVGAGHLRHYVLSGFKRYRDELFEMGTLFVLFVFVPPLLSFVVYFCGWHAARHSLRLAEELDHTNRDRGICRFLYLALPLTCLTLVLGVVMWWFLLPSSGVNAASGKAVFMMLSALTFPHMFFHWLRDTGWPLSFGKGVIVTSP